MLLYSRLYCLVSDKVLVIRIKFKKKLSGVCFNGFIEAQRVKLDRDLEGFQTFGGCKRNLHE